MELDAIDKLAAKAFEGFIVRKERVLRLLAAMRERRLHEGIRFSCFVRSNLLDDVVKFSILALSDVNGAVVKEALPPKR